MQCSTLGIYLDVTWLQILTDASHVSVAHGSRITFSIVSKPESELRKQLVENILVELSWIGQSWQIDYVDVGGTGKPAERVEKRWISFLGVPSHVPVSWALASNFSNKKVRQRKSLLCSCRPLTPTWRHTFCLDVICKLVHLLATRPYALHRSNS